MLEAQLSWEPEDSAAVTRVVAPGESFGLLEGAGQGWTLCIPDGAEAQIDGLPLDLHGLFPEPSGERRLPLRDGTRAHVKMGPFAFSVRPAAN